MQDLTGTKAGFASVTLLGSPNVIVCVISCSALEEYDKIEGMRSSPTTDSASAAILYGLGFKPYDWVVGETRDISRVIFGVSSLTNRLQRKFLPSIHSELSSLSTSWSAILFRALGLRPATLLKRDSDTVVFLLNLRDFQEHPFRRTSAIGCFCQSLP